MKIRFILPLVLAIFAAIGIGCSGGGKKTPSGYAYTHHIKNEGAHPKVGDYARIQTTVMLDDSMLYNTYDVEYMPPMNIQADSLRNKTTRPLMEALELMAEGDSLTLFMPLDSIENVPAELRKFKQVIHHMKLEKILNQADFEAEMKAQNDKRQADMLAMQAREKEVSALVAEEVKAYAAGKVTGIQSHEVKLDGGKTATLKMRVIEEGKGNTPKTGSIVAVNYYGVLTNGRMFDNSYQRGKAYEFPLGNKQVIAGWDEGIARLKSGGKAFLYIPYELAYGEAGRPSEDPANPGIPPKSELIFYVELQKVYK